jgi:hypothetical protein
MSDEQILQDIRNYSNAGMTQEQIYLELTKKGVTVDQIQRLKERYGNRQELATPASAGVMQEAEHTPEVVVPRERREEELIPQEDRIFGQDFLLVSSEIPTKELRCLLLMHVLRKRIKSACAPIPLPDGKNEIVSATSKKRETRKSFRKEAENVLFLTIKRPAYKKN